MENNISELKKILNRGNVILFTGTGFSKFGKNGYGDSLMDGNQLKEYLLISELKYDRKSSEFNELKNESLSDVCRHFEHEKNAEYLKDLLIDKFSNCIPTQFHHSYTKYPWKKIYTTNIDDLLENTYGHGKISVQNKHRPNLINSTGKIEYLKLHGCVKNATGRFVFGSSDYIDSMLKSEDYRFNQFGNDIQFFDFIFVGTEYSEVNLDYYLKLYKAGYGVSSSGKLIFINPRPSMIFRSKVESHGGKVIEWTTEQLADFLDKEITSTLSKEKKEQIDGYYHLNEKLFEFSKTKNYNSNLYLGFEPKWLDIYFDWDFANNYIDQHFTDYLTYIEKYSIKHSVLALVGKTLSGKSVYLKRCGYRLAQDGFEIYQLIGRRFDYFSLNRLIRNSSNNKFCLLIDNASYYYNALRSLLKNLPKNKLVIILTASRPFFHYKKKYNLITEDFTEIIIENGIDNDFAEEIENKLNNKGFIGSMKSKSKVERINLIKRKNDVASMLYEITFGKGFIQKFTIDVSSNYGKLQNGKDILNYLAICNEIDIPFLPLELVTQILPGGTKEALNEIDDFIKYNEYKGIELRNNILSKSILQKINTKTKLENITEILINISPQLTSEMSTYWNEMQASLMKEKLLRKRLGIKTKEIKDLLFSIKNYYNDDYNFWLQLGIAEQIEFDFEKALNHFRQAEALSPKSYMVQNAIARNFLKQANYQKEYHAAKLYFDEGEKLMTDLIRKREEFQVKAFSTHCYIYEKINFYQNFKLNPSNIEIKDLFKMLKAVTDKAPEDLMSKHISNKFYEFLKAIDKTSVVKLSFNDMGTFKMMIEKLDIDAESLFEDFEIYD